MVGPGQLQGRFPLLPAVLAAMVAVLAVTIVSGHGMRPAAYLTAAVALLSLAGTTIKRWHTLVCLIVVVIMFVPIRRYEFRTGMPFDLEPYRILVAVVTCLWIAALLVDRRLHLRRSGFEGPLALFLIAILGSILTNEGRLRDRQHLILNGVWFVRADLALASLKTFLFLLSFFAVFYVTVSVVRSERSIHVVLKTLVASGAIVAFFALIEFRTGYNVFNHLQGVLPLSTFEGALTTASIARGGRLRVYASAEHPIALASMFVMLLPLAAYLWRRTRQPLWALAALLLLLGALSTVSRTSVTALGAELAVFVWLRRDSVKRLWPLLIPGLLAIHVAVPGAIGGLQGGVLPVPGTRQPAVGVRGPALLGSAQPPVQDHRGQPGVRTGVRHASHVEWPRSERARSRQPVARYCGRDGTGRSRSMDLVLLQVHPPLGPGREARSLPIAAGS